MTVSNPSNPAPVNVTAVASGGGGLGANVVVPPAETPAEAPAPVEQVREAVHPTPPNDLEHLHRRFERLLVVLHQGDHVDLDGLNAVRSTP
jgi:hypothetical protein